MARVKFALSLLCSTIALSLLGGEIAAAGQEPAPSVVPLDVEFGKSPAPVEASGRDHLLYEMRLTNYSGRTIVLTEIDVLDSNGGRPLGAFAAKDLATMIATPGQQKEGADRLQIGPGGFVVVYFDTAVPKGTGAGLRLGHHIHVASASSGPPDPSRTILEAPPLTVSSETPLVVNAPLGPGHWLAANALSNDSDHRRTIAVVDGQARIAQRYAIDFVKIDAHGRAFTGDPSKNESWAGYGEPVLAVADAVVERILDGLPDNQPLAPPAIKIGLDTIAGNHIVLRLPGGKRVLYGHLRPGSIRVKEGERVRVGEVLAALGNSGQSDAPHLHIHVADAASPLGADGLPFAFRSFRLEGYAPSLDILENPGGWTGPATSDIATRHRELPTDLAVIAF